MLSPLLDRFVVIGFVLVVVAVDDVLVVVVVILVVVVVVVVLEHDWVHPNKSTPPRDEINLTSVPSVCPRCLTSSTKERSLHRLPTSRVLAKVAHSFSQYVPLLIVLL